MKTKENSANHREGGMNAPEDSSHFVPGPAYFQFDPR
jgi:hypothetical protein